MTGLIPLREGTRIVRELSCGITPTMGCVARASPWHDTSAPVWQCRKGVSCLLCNPVSTTGDVPRGAVCCPYDDPMAYDASAHASRHAARGVLVGHSSTSRSPRTCTVLSVPDAARDARADKAWPYLLLLLERHHGVLLRHVPNMPARIAACCAWWPISSPAQNIGSSSIHAQLQSVRTPTMRVPPICAERADGFQHNTSLTLLLRGIPRETAASATCTALALDGIRLQLVG